MDWNDNGIDLTDVYIDNIRQKLLETIQVSHSREPSGALYLLEWLETAADRLDRGNLAAILFNAEQEGIFDLEPQQIYKEADANKIVQQLEARLIYHSEMIDDFEVGIGKPPKQTKSKQAKPKQSAQAKEKTAKTLAEIFEQDEEISSLGTALEKGADIELPFEKWRKKHEK